MIKIIYSNFNKEDIHEYELYYIDDKNQIFKTFADDISKAIEIASKALNYQFPELSKNVTYYENLSELKQQLENLKENQALYYTIDLVRDTKDETTNLGKVNFKIVRNGKIKSN